MDTMILRPAPDGSRVLVASPLEAVTLILPGERPPSWNAAYAGQHWAKRAEVVARIRAAVRAALDPDWPLFEGLVDITVTAVFDKQPLDADNIPAKLYVDGLKGWLLADDDLAHVRSVRTVALVDPARPRVEITVETEDWL